jgi:hypothetical protein
MTYQLIKIIKIKLNKTLLESMGHYSIKWMVNKELYQVKLTFCTYNPVISKGLHQSLYVTPNDKKSKKVVTCFAVRFLIFLNRKEQLKTMYSAYFHSIMTY